jgi:hypothetical protein
VSYPAYGQCAGERARRHFSSCDAWAVAGLLSALGFGALFAQSPQPDLEAMPFAPRRYVSYRSPAPIDVDSKLDERAWASAAWTDLFTDIEGDRRPQPRFRTRGKMLWDDQMRETRPRLPSGMACLLR